MKRETKRNINHDNILAGTLACVVGLFVLFSQTALSLVASGLKVLIGPDAGVFATAAALFVVFVGVATISYELLINSFRSTEE